MTDRTELRRLLDEATPGPWEVEESQIWGPDGAFVAAVRWGGGAITDLPDALLIAAAVSALPDLLDQLDAAEAALARVRELHASSGTAESQGYGAHGTYGFIAPYCTGCEASDEYAVVWPCPTIAAIGGES